MAKKYILVLLFLTACALVPKKNRLDQGLNSNEGIIKGRYIFPSNLDRRGFFDVFFHVQIKKAIFEFINIKTDEKINIETDETGQFEFKAPQGTYLLLNIISKTSDAVRIKSKHGLIFNVTSQKTYNLRDFTSSCEPWDENKDSKIFFREFILNKKYSFFKVYNIDDYHTCLVFFNPIAL